MHTNELLHKILSPVIHQKRLTTLKLFVCAALSNKKLSLTHLGRSLELPIQERSGIRRADRFLGNSHLHHEREHIYQACIRKLIGGKTRPCILVDWTPVPNTTHHLLRAALSTEGRALTLYEEVHIEKQLGSRKVQTAFLQKLKSLLPAHCQPIMITDAGFQNPWFQAVLALGWDYIGRVRGGTYYRKQTLWCACQSLWQHAGKTVLSLGEVLLSKSSPLNTFLYLIQEEEKGRQALTKQGQKRRSHHSQKHSKSAKEPWIIASSLGNSAMAAQQVIKRYKKRMQIEESFRDLKSARLGFSFEHAYSRQPKRIEVLLLIMMLAALIAWLTGWVAEKKQWHYQFQVSSLSTRRILSLFYLGCQVIRRRIPIPIAELEQAFNEIRRICS